jgi:hypothetical protein
MNTSSFRPIDTPRPLQIVSPIEEWCGVDEAGMRGGFPLGLTMLWLGIYSELSRNLLGPYSEPSTRHSVAHCRGIE